MSGHHKSSDLRRAGLVRAGLWDGADERDPSTDIAAAWELVERLIEHRTNPQRDVHIEYLGGMGWSVSFCHVDGQWDEWTRAPTAPEAICKAVMRYFARATGIVNDSARLPGEPNAAAGPVGRSTNRATRSSAGN